MKINSGILKPPKVGNTQRPFDNTENTTNTMKEAISAEPATTTKPRIPSEPTWVIFRDRVAYNFTSSTAVLGLTIYIQIVISNQWPHFMFHN